MTTTGYPGLEQRAENQGSQVEWRVALKRGKREALAETAGGQWLEQAKASIQAWVEYPFHVIKKQFKQRKTHDRGLANRVLVGRRSSGLHSQVAP